MSASKKNIVTAVNYHLSSPLVHFLYIPIHVGLLDARVLTSSSSGFEFTSLGNIFIYPKYSMIFHLDAELS